MSIHNYPFSHHHVISFVIYMLAQVTNQYNYTFASLFFENESLGYTRPPSSLPAPFHHF